LKRVVLFGGPDTFETFRAARSSDWQDFQIYTLRPAKCLELRVAGIPARNLGEHILAADAYRIYQRAFAEATHIAKVVSEAQGRGLVQLSRLFKVYYWEFLVEVYAMDAVLNEWGRERESSSPYYVRWFGPPPTTHAQLADPGPLGEQIFNVLHLRGQAESIQARSPFRANTWRPLLGRLRHVQRYAFWALRKFIEHKSTEPLELAIGKWAIGWGSSYDALIVIPDMIRVAEETGLKPLLVTEGIDSSTNRTGLVYKESYDSIERFSVGRYLAGRPVPHLTLAEHEEVERAYRGLLKAIDATEVGAKYRLSSLFENLHTELVTSLILAKQLDDILSQWVGSSLVLTDFNGLKERIIEQLAPRYNIQVQARTHGWLANPEGYEFEAAHYVVPGTLQAQFVRDFLGYREQVVIRPDHNLMRVAEEWLNNSEEKRQAIIAEKKHSLGIRAKHIILILATMARNRTLSEFDYPTFCDCWLHILNYLKSHPEIHVVVKAHPQFNYNPWLSALSKQQKVQNLSILSGRLEEVLGLADLVVDLGKPGTGTIVALLFRKPLLLYERLYKYVRELGDLAYAVGESFTVENPAALLEQWERLGREGEAYLRTLRIRNQVLFEALISNEN